MVPDHLDNNNKNKNNSLQKRCHCYSGQFTSTEDNLNNFQWNYFLLTMKTGLWEQTTQPLKPQPLPNPNLTPCKNCYRTVTVGDVTTSKLVLLIMVVEFSKSPNVPSPQEVLKESPFKLSVFSQMPPSQKCVNMSLFLFKSKSHH